jgi:glutathione S-transferase
VPIDPSLKKLLDEEMGPLARQAAYIHILNPVNSTIFDQLFTENKHWLWRLLWRLYFGRYLRNHMVKFMKPFDPVANRECREKLDKVFAELGVLITNKKTPYLGGETPGVADIALASLMAPLITPPLYCKGQFAHIFDKLEARDPAVRAEATHWRSTVAGEYAMSLYRDHRL